MWGRKEERQGEDEREREEGGQKKRGEEKRGVGVEEGERASLQSQKVSLISFIGSVSEKTWSVG